MNNIVNIRLKNYNNKPIISDTPILQFKLYKYNNEYVFKDGEIYLSINSKEKLSTIYKHFMIHYKLLFLNNGYFYEIKEYRENNKIVDISKYSNIEAYKTNNEFIKNYKITNIKNLINKESISEFSKIENKYKMIFNAFNYLHSDRYNSVLCDHKFMILSQLCEGYIENSEHEKHIKTADFKGRIGIYIDLFRKIDIKINAEIFKILNTYPEKIKKQIKNTRHMYSHYTKKDKTIKGENFIYLYYILELAFRILVLDDINIKYGDEVKENLYSIHDWIMEKRKESIKIEEYKSITYKISKTLGNIHKIEGG